MTTQQKLMIGGLGALTPIIINLLVIDLNLLLLNLTTVTVLAYIIRVVVLFYLGGLIAFLHKDENSPVKLFQLGIAAPALITGLLNATSVEVPKAPAQTKSASSASILSIPSAHAQTAEKKEMKTFSLPKETLGEQIQRGLIGSIPKRVWFVIAGSYLKLENAEKYVQEIEKKFGAKGFKGEVYAPYGGNPYYAVVIGANLTYQEALDLRQKAITAALPKDTYLWTFPK